MNVERHDSMIPLPTGKGRRSKKNVLSSDGTFFVCYMDLAG